jgi:ribosomal protein L7/L12
MYTLREVVAYATMTGCVAFMVGFLIEAYTRIFSGSATQKDLPKWQQLALDKDHYIDAVREYRNSMHSTLREAKEAVDNFLTYHSK